MSEATIVQVSISPGGVPKLPVPQARVTPLGLEGDGHDDKVHHGGSERALCLFSLEKIDALKAEGHPIAPGTTGENVTIQGLDWDSIDTGQQIRLGEVVVRITGDSTPCKTIVDSFQRGDFLRISQQLNPGWSRFYASVVAEGTIRPGDPVELLDATTA